MTLGVEYVLEERAWFLVQLHMSYRLNSLTGEGYLGDYIGNYDRGE